ncbi:MAG: hypothetical protein EB127_28280 [Alphaproteobacteria bacterium]|nr:hypothetical protein [Alphaproteobacteria bacterium]
MSNGKGSKQRPLSVSYDEYAVNFDSIFRKKDRVYVPVKKLPNGDQYIDLPQEILEKLDWKAGDKIEWKEDGNGTYVAIKK